LVSLPAPRFSLVERFELDGHWSSWAGFQELPMTRPDDPVADKDFVFSLLLSLKSVEIQLINENDIHSRCSDKSQGAL